MTDTTRKTRARTAPEDTIDVRETLRQTVEMIRFLSQNPQYRANDYLADPTFPTGEIRKLLSHK